jgi:hypothetical protein
MKSSSFISPPPGSLPPVGPPPEEPTNPDGASEHVVTMRRVAMFILDRSRELDIPEAISAAGQLIHLVYASAGSHPGGSSQPDLPDLLKGALRKAAKLITPHMGEHEDILYLRAMASFREAVRMEFREPAPPPTRAPFNDTPSV